MERITLITKPSEGYELLDSGGEEKLERFGSVVLSRPDPQALWPKNLSKEEWDKAAGKYVRAGVEAGKWTGSLEKSWPVSFGGLQMILKPTSFKHTGLFPEQLSNWEWMQKMIEGKRDVKILNLFGYTGGATLAAAQAGAEVTHVDASKTAVVWARENAEASGLGDKPIRWMVDDVLAFVKKEIKRGKKYDGIVMDPPAFGHGPKDELWKIESDLIELLTLCQKLLSEKPLFVLLNGYAAGYSPLAFAYNLIPFKETVGGTIEYGELTLEESGSSRLLPSGIFARWSRS